MSTSTPIDTMKVGDRVQINPVWDGIPRKGLGTISAIWFPNMPVPYEQAVAVYGSSYAPIRLKPVKVLRIVVRRDDPKNEDNLFLILPDGAGLKVLNQIAAGHNPSKLTEEQVGVADGWRLPEWGEIDGLSGAKRQESLECWDFTRNRWRKADAYCVYHQFTYRTKLSREELAALRKPKMRLIRGTELPPVCWVGSSERRWFVTYADSCNLLVVGDGGQLRDIKSLADAGDKWSSDLKTWNSFEVEDK